MHGIDVVFVAGGMASGTIVPRTRTIGHTGAVHRMHMARPPAAVNLGVGIIRPHPHRVVRPKRQKKEMDCDETLAHTCN